MKEIETRVTFHSYSIGRASHCWSSGGRLFGRKGGRRAAAVLQDAGLFHGSLHSSIVKKNGKCGDDVITHRTTVFTQRTLFQFFHNELHNLPLSFLFSYLVLLF